MSQWYRSLKKSCVAFAVLELVLQARLASNSHLLHDYLTGVLSWT